MKGQADLNHYIRESLIIYHQPGPPGNKSVSRTIIAIQTFGDFLGFDPHGHVPVTDGGNLSRGFVKGKQRCSDSLSLYRDILRPVSSDPGNIRPNSWAR